jgi:cupin superfamily acireductone dioxygenase involved in methionine salvage
MTYEVVDIETGDVLSVFPSFEAAQEAACSYVDEHPHLADEIAVATVDSTGHAASISPVAELHEHA